MAPQIKDLAELDRARNALQNARTLSEVKKIRNLAEAARTYAKAAHLGRESQNYAAEISLLASRKAGEILKELRRDTPKQAGAKKGKRAATRRGPATRAVASEYAQTLADTQTPERTAQHWQNLAAVPAKTVENYVRKTKETGDEITAVGLRKFYNAENAPAEVLHKANYYKPVLAAEAPQLTADLSALRLRVADYINLLKRDGADFTLEQKTETKTLIRTLREFAKDADRLERILESEAA